MQVLRLPELSHMYCDNWAGRFSVPIFYDGWNIRLRSYFKLNGHARLHSHGQLKPWNVSKLTNGATTGGL